MKTDNDNPLGEVSANQLMGMSTAALLGAVIVREVGDVNTGTEYAVLVDMGSVAGVAMFVLLVLGVLWLLDGSYKMVIEAKDD